MKLHKVILIIMFSSSHSAFSSEWPVLLKAEHTSGTPAPGNTGTGELLSDRIHPNERTAVIEEWSLEFVSASDFKLFSNLTGDNGQFSNYQECRSFNGRMVLKIGGSPPEKVVIGDPHIGDIFTFQITSVPAPIEDGSMMNIYGNYTSNATFQNWHEGVDIYASSSDRNVYPVRDGIVVRVELAAPYYDHFIVIQPVSPLGTPIPGTFDWYGHIWIPEVSANQRVYASGREATKLATGLTFPDYNHLHFGVYDDLKLENQVKSIKNPQNGLIPLPADDTAPECKEICFRSNDPTPVPTLFYSSIRGKTDILAKIGDNNGAPVDCGVHQAKYDIYQGLSAGDSLNLKQGTLLNSSTFCGESGFSSEYSPYWFNLYGFMQVEWDIVFDERSGIQNNWYVLTNNVDSSGDKSGFTKNGCWDTEQVIGIPTVGVAKKYPDGPYSVLVKSADIAGNWSNDDNAANMKRISVLNDYERIIYVDDDADGFGSIDAPFKSITEAISEALPGDMVFVAPGVYDSSQETFPIHIPEQVMLKGSGQDVSIIQGSSSNPVIQILADNCSISDFTIRGGAISGIGQITIENGPANVTIQDCRIEGNPAQNISGVWLHFANYPLINNCLIVNHGSDGIRINDALHPDIANCTFDSNDIGINADDGVLDGIISNSIFVNHSRAIRAYSGSYLGVLSSDCFASGSPWYLIGGGSSIATDGYVIQVDPLFESGSYYLQETSSCVGWGCYSGYYYSNSWYIDPYIYLRTTRADNQPFSNDLFDDGNVDIGFHYLPVSAPSPTETPTPTMTPTPVDSLTPTAIPTSTATFNPGIGQIAFDYHTYYTESGMAKIMLVDPDLNTDPYMTEFYDVTVISGSDPLGIPMTVRELSADSVGFSSWANGVDLGFTTAASIPYQMIHVADSDIVTVLYDDDSPTGIRSDSAYWFVDTPLPTNTSFPTSSPTSTATVTGTPTPTSTVYAAGEYFEDFETGAHGWTMNGLWHLTLSSYYSPSHSTWYGQELIGNYDTGAPNQGSLISPPILLTDYYHLMFQSREEVEGTGTLADTRKVSISTDDGVSWSLLHQSQNDADSWYAPYALDLAAYTGQVVRIRFAFDTFDELYNDHTGWFVDDVRIGIPPLPIPSIDSWGVIMLLAIFATMLHRMKK